MTPAGGSSRVLRSAACASSFIRWRRSTIATRAPPSTGSSDSSCDEVADAARHVWTCSGPPMMTWPPGPTGRSQWRSGWLPCVDEPAAPAGAARPRRPALGRAQQPRREVQRQRRLADPGRAAEQDRVRRPDADHRVDRLERRRVTPGPGAVHGAGQAVGGRRLAGRASLRRRASSVAGVAASSGARRRRPCGSSGASARGPRRRSSASGAGASAVARWLAGRPTLRRRRRSLGLGGRGRRGRPHRRSARPCAVVRRFGARSLRLGLGARPIGAGGADAVRPASGRSGPGAAPRARAGPRSTRSPPRRGAGGARRSRHRDRRSGPRAAAAVRRAHVRIAVDAPPPPLPPPYRSRAIGRLVGGSPAAWAATAPGAATAAAGAPATLLGDEVLGDLRLVEVLVVRDRRQSARRAWAPASRAANPRPIRMAWSGGPWAPRRPRRTSSAASISVLLVLVEGRGGTGAVRRDRGAVASVTSPSRPRPRPRPRPPRRRRRRGPSSPSPLRRCADRGDRRRRRPSRRRRA